MVAPAVSTALPTLDDFSHGLLGLTDLLRSGGSFGKHQQVEGLREGKASEVRRFHLRVIVPANVAGTMLLSQPLPNRTGFRSTPEVQQACACKAGSPMVALPERRGVVW